MRKVVLLFKFAFAALAILVSFNAHAVVASPDPAVVTQPDGSQLILLLHGDEWFNYATTRDGYTVVQDPADGYYKYAVLSSDQLVPSAIAAHDTQRTAQEQAFIASSPRHLTPSQSAIGAMRAPARRLHGMTGHYNYKNFRGLVILVQFNDCEFVYDDPHTLFDNMINEKNFTGFMSNAMFPEFIPYTGSVRDYFYDSSAGEFDPHFDVVGPVTIDYSVYSANKTSNAQTLVSAALDAADSLVNYKDYDRDNNGVVDMVFFMFAGPGSNFGGNDQRLLWPHASTVYSKSIDGVSFDRYACSTELYGRPESQIIDGIGTMCHEFSHVLGIADLYDTNGTSSGGSCVTPGRWSLMAQGSYLNQSRTPCAYSIYERYAAGFITPETLTHSGRYTLKPIGKINNGYRLNTIVPDEYFLLETRTLTGWDAYLPGAGMLVWRVDSTNVDAWENNKVNCNPAHPYYELIRASGGEGNTAADPFPGSAGITAIDNNTTPSLRSWTGSNSPCALSNITMTPDSAITFALALQRMENKVEDFETMDLTTADATGVTGRFTSWTLSKGARIAATGTDNAGNGTQACLMVRSSELVSDTLPWEVQSFTFDFYNPTSSTTTVRTYYNTPDKTTWVTLKDADGLESITVAARTQATLKYSTVLPQGAKIRIVEYTGNRTNPCYVDDITCLVESQTQGLWGDLNGDGTIDVSDINVLVNYILGNSDVTPQDLNGDGTIDVSDINALVNLILQ